MSRTGRLVVPGRAEDTIGKAILIKWWLLRVCGPLPGRPAGRGEFVMQVSGYGHRPGWWISVAELAGTERHGPSVIPPALGAYGPGLDSGGTALTG